MQLIRPLIATLLLAACALPAAAQTIKTLGYNTTNGHVVYSGTNTLTFTNAFKFSDDLLLSNNIFRWGTNNRWAPEDNLFFADLQFDTTNIAAATRTNLGLGATWLTNTNVTNFRTAVGLGATNDVVFNQLTVNGNVINGAGFFYAGDFNSGLNIEEGWIKDVSTNQVLDWGSANDLSVGRPILFTSTTNAATTRTNLGLPLAALTNTSNVTAMRALAGSTNTNHPYSGSISVTGTSNTNTLVFSNGILQSVQ